MAEHDDHDRRESTPPHANTGGPSAGSHLDDPSLQILQQINSLIQGAIAQNRINVEQLINEKLASYVNNNRTQGGPEAHTDNHTSHTHADRVSFKTFKGCGATEFSGAVDPIIAYSWLTNIEKIFEISHCWETDKVIYATAMLTDQALDWWIAFVDAIGEDQRRAMTWATFKEKLMLQYCPPDLQHQYEKEFFNLKQGSMSVIAYEAEFLKKSKFAKVFLPSEEVRIRRFVEGLRWDIREFVQIREITSLEKAAEYARERENALEVRHAELTSLSKQVPTDHPSNLYSPLKSESPERSFTDHHSQVQFQSSPSVNPQVCNFCGQKHFGVCNNHGRSDVGPSHFPSVSTTVICQRCGKVGHKMPNCRHRNTSSGCYECDEIGHIRRDCPYLKLAASPNSATRPIANTSVTPSQTRGNSTSRGRGRIPKNVAK